MWNVCFVRCLEAFKDLLPIETLCRLDYACMRDVCLFFRCWIWLPSLTCLLIAAS